MAEPGASTTTMYPESWDYISTPAAERVETLGRGPTLPAPPPLEITRPAAPAPAAPAAPSVNLDVRLTEPPLPPPSERVPERAALARQALAALLNPTSIAERLQAMEESRVAQAEAYEKAQKELEGRRAKRQAMEDEAYTAIREFREGQNDARPQIPTLESMPEVPDLKVRPWLDPEGRDALTVIAQGLGMLATGIGGMVIGAPLTAIKQFKDAAAAWRQDQIDRASSHFEQFKATVMKIDADNKQALQVYDLKDKEYGANQEAKRAAIIVELQALGLHDAATQAALLPFELGIRQHTTQLDASAKILDATMKFAGVIAKLDKAQSAIPTSLWKAIGEASIVQQQIQSEPDPERKADLTRRLGVLKESITEYQRLMLDRSRVQAGFGLARTVIPRIQDDLLRVDHFVASVDALEQAYATLHRKGLLPTSATKISEWSAAIQRQFPTRWDTEAQNALGVIETFFGPTTVTFDRTVLDDKGARFAAAFGTALHNPMMPYTKFQGLARVWISEAKRARHLQGLRMEWANSLSGGAGIHGMTEGEAGGEGEPE